MATVMYNYGVLTEAQAYLQKAWRIQPSQELCRMLITWFHLKDRNDAVSWVKKGLARYPSDPSLQALQLDLQLLSQRSVSSEQAKALNRFFPFIENHSVLNNCAWFIQEAGLVDAAEKWSRKAYDNSTNPSSAIKHTLGTILARQGNFTEAEPLLKHLYEDEVASANSLIPLLACCVALNNTQTTDELIRRIETSEIPPAGFSLEWYKKLKTL